MTTTSERTQTAINTLHCAEINCDNARTTRQPAFIDVVKMQIQSAIEELGGYPCTRAVLVDIPTAVGNEG